MIWFFVGGLAVTGIAGWLLKDDEEHDEPGDRSAGAREDTHFESNLRWVRGRTAQLERPWVAIVGQPGAGKSSLLLSVTRQGCSPLPIIGPHTDATDWSGADRPPIHKAGNASYVDTPGLGTAKHPIGPFLASFPFDGATVILFVIAGKFRETDARLARYLYANAELRDRTIWVRTHADAIEPAVHAEIQRDLAGACGPWPVRLHFVSNRTGHGMAALRRAISRRIRSRRRVRSVTER